MFAAHVPERYRDLAPRIVEEPGGSLQWYYGEIRGRNLGLNAVAGKSPEMFNVDPTRYDEMRPGCYDVHERVRDMSAGGQLAGLELPELDRLLRTGAQRRARPRAQPRDDQGVQRLARRRVVRGVPGPLHPVRDPAALRRARSRGRGAPARRQGLPRGHVLGEPGGARHAEHPLGRVGSACSPRAATTGTVLCCHVGSSSKSASTAADAPRAGADEPLVGDGDLHARRPVVGRLLAPVPRVAIRADRGRHRLDPLLPATRRAHARPAQRMDAPRRAARPVAEPSSSASASCAASSRTASASSSSITSTSTTSAGSPTTRTPTARGPTRPEHLEPLFADLDREAVDKITHLNAMLHFRFDPFAITSARTLHGRPRCAPKQPTSTRSRASAGRPTNAISRPGAS